jgi:hypothetical protein
MKRKNMLSVASVILIAVLGSIGIATAQNESYPCETCPMTVGPDALEHLKVTDGNGTRHYVECIGCALKLLKTYDTIHIETYCDWYGPDYPIIIDISQHGAVTTVNPSAALTLVGGGCTGNRMAYNQTAADALLVNGFSQYTMMMMQQPLPANTNVTTIDKRALAFALTDTIEPPQSPLIPILLVVAAIVVVGVSIVAYKKIKH